MSKFIPEVQKLVNSAPEMEKWNVVAFRQPSSAINEVVCQDIKLCKDDVYFYYLDGHSKSKLDLKFYIKSYDANDPRYLNCLFLLLDSLLGEYEVMTTLGTMEYDKLPEDLKTKSLISIKELPNILKEKFKNNK